MCNEGAAEAATKRIASQWDSSAERTESSVCVVCVIYGRGRDTSFRGTSFIGRLIQGTYDLIKKTNGNGIYGDALSWHRPVCTGFFRIVGHLVSYPFIVFHGVGGEGHPES